MSGTQSRPSCPECGAERESNSSRCWLCQAEVEPLGELPASPTSQGSTRMKEPREVAAPTRGLQGSQFSLATLMLCVTLAAVTLGLMRVWFVLGLGLIVVTVPAIFRAGAMSSLQQRQRRRPPELTEKFVNLLSSLAVMTLVAAAGAAAFFATCFAGGMSVAALGEATGASGYDHLMIALVVGVGGGGIVALVVIGSLLQHTWPSEKKK